MPAEKPLDDSAAQALDAAAQALGLEIDARQRQALLAYLQQLQRWNATYNLTAIRDPRQMLIQHVFDSLAIIAPLRRRWQDAIDVLDAGSGAGLPGVVIAIMQPHWRVTCVDAVEKKTVFIQQVTRNIGIRNVTARHARIETLAHVHPDARYALAVSRAFAALKDFAVLAGPCVAADGVLAAMKGKVPDDEIAAVERDTDWRVAAVQPLAVPQLDAQRCLIWLRRADQDKGARQASREQCGNGDPHSKETHAPG